MKKYFIAVVLVIITMLGAKAADPTMALDVKFNYASQYNNPGLGFEFQLGLFDNFRLAPEFDVYFENDGAKFWDMNYNVQYVIYPFSNFTIYPFAGYTFAHWSYDWQDSKDRSGANIGSGAEYVIGSNVSFFTEWRYVLMSHHNQSVTSLGVKFKF